MKNQDHKKIHFVEKFFRLALHNLDMSEQDKSDPIAFRRLQCSDPSLMPTLIRCLKEHFQSIQIEVDHLDYSAIGSDQSPLLAAQSSVDRLHGPGAFLQIAEDVGFVPPFADLLSLDPHSFDAFMESHWSEFNAYRWSARCSQLMHAYIDALALTDDDSKSRVLIIQQPQFSKRACFNFLYNLFIRLSRMGASAYGIIIFALDQDDLEVDLDAMMFFKTLQANGIQQQPFILHIPPPHSLNKLFLDLDLDEELAREKALDVSQFLVQKAQQRSPNLAPTSWVEAYGLYLKDLPLGPVAPLSDQQEGTAELSESFTQDLASELRLRYLLCDFEGILQLAQGADPSLPLLQYLDLMASYPTNAHRYPEWVDDWLASSGKKSRFVAAALHRELWFHKKDAEREQLCKVVLEQDPPSDGLTLQLVCSWILTLWRASHAEMRDQGQVFLQRLAAVSRPHEQEIAADLASIIILNQVVVESSLHDKGEVLEHIIRLYQRRQQILNYAPQLTTELCFLFDYLWNYFEDPDDYNVFEVSRSDYETRTCYNRFVTLSIFATNLATGLAKTGFYGEAIRYERASLILAERTQNERDIGLALLGTVLHVCGGASTLEVNRAEVSRGFDCMIRKSGSMEHVLHYYQLTLWNLFCYRDWELCQTLLTAALRFVQEHGLQSTKDAAFLQILEHLLSFQRTAGRSQDEAVLPAQPALQSVHANYAEMSHSIYNLIYHFQQADTARLHETLEVTEKYLKSFKQRIPDSELSILMQTLIHCQIPWTGPALSIGKQARIRYVESFIKAWSDFEDKKLYAESPKAQLLLAAFLGTPILDQEIWLYVADSFSRISNKPQLTYSFCLALTALLDPIRLLYSAEKNAFYDIHRVDQPLTDWQLPLARIWDLSHQDESAATPLPSSEHTLDLKVFARGQTIQLHFRTAMERDQCRNFFEKSALGKFIIKAASSRFAEIQELRSSRHFRILSKKQNEMMRKSTIEMSELLDQERKSLRTTVAELQKQHVSRMKLYASLFHDIKTPAQRTVEKLREALQEKNNSQLPIILNQCMNNQNGIIDKLDRILLQSKSGLDTKLGKRSQIPLKSLMDKVSEQFIWEANRLQIDFIMAPVDPRIVISAVAEDVEIILVNILSNALRFTPPGGLVQLKTSMLEGTARIEVEDNGIGMSQAQIESLGASHETQAMSFGFTSKGNGLGLSIVRALLDDQEGQLHIASEPGKFTRVFIDLPLDAASRQGEAQGSDPFEADLKNSMPHKLQAASTDGIGLSVLIVEPDHSIRENFARGLEGSYAITRTSDGSEALRLIQKHDFDFILCNYETVPLGGMGLLQKLSALEARPQTFFIMTASSDNAAIRQTSLEGGAVDFISFPFSSHELKQRLQNLLVSRAPESSNENDKPDILLHRNYREFLIECFQNKKNRRPSFSHRRLMQIVGAKSPSFFKRIVDGEVIVTSDMAMRLAQVFSLNELEKELFFAMVAEGREGDGQSKSVLRAKEKLIRSLGSQKPRPLSALVQNSVWPGIILLLTRAKKFDGTAAWISSHLGGTLAPHAIQAILDSFQRQGIPGPGSALVGKEQPLIEIEETRHALDSLTSLQDLVHMCLDRSSIQAINFLFPRSRHKEIMTLVEDAWIDFCSALRSLDEFEHETGAMETDQDLCHIALIVAPCSLVATARTEP